MVWRTSTVTKPTLSLTILSTSSSCAPHFPTNGDGQNGMKSLQLDRVHQKKRAFRPSHLTAELHPVTTTVT